jgi:alpha-tubulin suppressor-like RCC1 family protein
MMTFYKRTKFTISQSRPKRLLGCLLLIVILVVSSFSVLLPRYSAYADDLTAMSPTSGPTTGGTTINFSVNVTTSTIPTGHGLLFGLMFGGSTGGLLAPDGILCFDPNTNAATVNGIYPTSCVTPAATAGIYPVRIIVLTVNLNGLTLVGANSIATSYQFTYTSATSPPAITSVSPTSGSVAGNTTLTVNGTNFMNRMTQISSGQYHTCGIYATDGQAYCWGQNNYGQLGNGTTIDSVVPVKVATGGSSAIPSNTTVLHISSGISRTCAIASDNLAYCWGQNDYGQLGNGSAADDDPHPYATAVIRGGTSSISTGTTFRKVETGGNRSCAITSDDLAHCWGYSDAGGPIPKVIAKGAIPASATFKDLTVGSNFYCVIANNDLAYCSGNNNIFGQLGNGTTSSGLPTAVLRGGTSEIPSTATFKSISVGDGFAACAIDNNDLAYCWGIGSVLGNGTTNNSPSPVAVTRGGTSEIPSTATFKSISVGTFAACAIDNNDLAYCWGTNSSLGNGSISGSSLPVAVLRGGTSAISSAVTYKSISTGGAYACVIASDDLTYCWGNNTSGQLGDYSTTTRSAPVLASAATTITGVKLDSTYDCTDLAAISDTQLTCKTPAHNVALVDVSITSASGTDTLPSAYQYYGVPDAPVISSATPGDGQIAVAWSVPNDNGSAIIDYTVYLSNSSSCSIYTNSYNTTNTSYTMTGLTNGITYYLCVQANSAVASSAYSTAISAMPRTVPTAPTLTSLMPVSGGVTINWIAPSNNGGSTVTSYVLQYSTSSSFAFYDQITGIASSSTSRTVNGLTSGTVYYFRLIAVNAAGISPDSNVLSSRDLYLSISSTGNMTLGVAPNRMSWNKNVVTVSTNNVSGYSITMSTETANTNLVHALSQTSNIPTIANIYTSSNPASSTTVNGWIGSQSFWAYRVNGLGNFGTVSLSAQFDQTSTNASWAAMPNSGSPAIIRAGTRTDDGIADTPQSTDVWFVASVIGSQASGQYSAKIIYTVVANS